MTEEDAANTSDVIEEPSPCNGFAENTHFLDNNELHEIDLRNEELKNLRDENERLREINERSEAESLAYQIQAENIEKLSDARKEELDLCKKSEQNLLKLNAKLENELNSMMKKYEAANAEKEGMVMKYAGNESKLIILRGEKDLIDKKLKEIVKERDEEKKKFKAILTEKNSLADTLDKKKCELILANENLDALKIEINEKLALMRKMEENYEKELTRCKTNEMDLLKRITTLENDIQGWKNWTKNNFTEELDENEEAALIGIGDNKNDDEEESKKPNWMMELRAKQSALLAENSTLKFEVEKLKRELFARENETKSGDHRIADLEGKLSHAMDELAVLEKLKVSCRRLEEEREEYRRELDALREAKEDLTMEMKSCRERDAELLDFTQKLTQKNVILQSENYSLQAAKIALENDRKPLEEELVNLRDEMDSLLEQGRIEKENWKMQETSKNEMIREKDDRLQDLTRQLEECLAEIQGLKHKYDSTVRELKKEVSSLYRKLEQREVDASGSETASLDSRANSCNSLNDQTPKVELDHQKLIDKIVKLQRANARYMEKMEFLEEHNAQLLAEMKKKTRLLQYYITQQEQSGALTSTSSEKHKENNLAMLEMGKYGGIMASLNGVKSEDASVTPELCMEINRKLQAVLEDTLLKNITLKENIETLGLEIERLTIKGKNNNN